jgi:tellurite resistance protein
MTSATERYAYTEDQIKAWLRGLLTIAWADGDFDDAEKEMIHCITDAELAPNVEFETFEPIAPADLAAVLHPNPVASENFLRMAVMVAIADGVYSAAEDRMLMEFCHALKLNPAVLQALESTLCNLRDIQEEIPPGTAGTASKTASPVAPLTAPEGHPDHLLDPLKPAREWMDQMEVHDPRLARFLCKLIPPQCPFERDVTLFGKKIVHIPPMCKLNPLYDQLVGLRFRALSYLADECHEDVTPYI